MTPATILIMLLNRYFQTEHGKHRQEAVKGGAVGSEPIIASMGIVMVVVMGMG